MIESAFNYSAVNSKVRSWLRTLVKPEEWSELLSKDIPEIIRFAVEKDDKIPSGITDTVSFEHALKQRSVFYAERIIPFLRGASRNFLKHWFKTYEMENVKTILRAVVGGNEVKHLYDLSRSLSKINFNEARTISTIDEFESFFSRYDDYKKVISYSINRVRESMNPFYFEVALDVNYYRKLWTMSLMLSKRDRDFVKRLIGRYLDVVNVVWIYRARFFFGMRPEEIIAYVAPYGARFTRKLLDKMLSVESFEEFVQVALEQKIISSPVSNLEEMEVQLNRDLFNEAKKAFMGYPFHIGVVLGFFVLKNQETKNYTSLINGKILGVAPEILGKFLVF